VSNVVKTWAHIAVPTLPGVVARHAQETPTRPAIVFGDTVHDYAALHQLACAAAQRLQELGINPARRLVFAGRNCDALAVLALASQMIGAVPVPLNWRLAPGEMAGIAADCDPPVIFGTREFEPVAAEIAARTNARVLPAEWLLQPADGTPTALGQAGDSEAIALQVYTSGTTGEPKGVMLSHRALLGINCVRGQLGWDSWSGRDVTLVNAPLGHIGAFGMMARALFFGGTTVIHEQFDADATLDAIERFGITKLALVPTAIKMLLDHPRSSTTNFANLDQIVYGSAPITPDLLQRAISVFGCDFVQSYGQTETSGPVVALPPADHDPRGNRRMTGAGLPMPETEVMIVSPSGGRLPTGETGEILIRSIANMSGYWNRPETTRATLDEDGWIHTGDAGYLDADGYLYVRSRVKEMIISGAENVYPAEVENALASHPDVAAVAVIGLPDAHWGEVVTAVVVPAPGSRLNGEAMRDWARARIAGYKVPKTVHFLRELPLTSIGKIDKRALIRQFATPA
jgi:acyl-CoA synthetase (AMP-forming)/AMP-acid ligase II